MFSELILDGLTRLPRNYRTTRKFH